LRIELQPKNNQPTILFLIDARETKRIVSGFDYQGQMYGIPFVPAEVIDNKRALDAHLMISAT
jgi:hypothetical protein